MLLCLQVNFIALSSYTAEVETFFLPQSQEEVYDRLNSFLDRAKSRILIAMYWLTDEKIFNKLLELKNKGRDVQIIFDESTPGAIDHHVAFSRNNIIAIVAPTAMGGIMHNKFVVIDDSAVWTGSANFTSTVLKPEGKRVNFNDENIIIINSPVAAEQYSNAFYFIEKNIIAFYLESIVEVDSKDLPNWMIPLCKHLYQGSRQFKETLNELLPQVSDFQRAKLRSLFPEEHPSFQQGRVGEEATDKQKAFLERHHIYPNMLKREATKLIGEIIKSEKNVRYKPY
jgi:phosphatidylserine/phosphatidylglycerophosphate/cardiolipin synthase-like enzyme